jgi:ferredoxin
MKASILTFSQTGNTLKVGASIAKGLQDSGLEVDCIRFLRRKRWKPDDADLIGIGCPCFENRPAECVLEFLKNGGFDFTGKKAFVFITSGGSPARSLWRLAQAVAQTGATVIGGVQLRGAVTVPTKFGEFTDRPNEKDLEYAEGFGRAVAANTINEETLPDHYKVDPSGGGRVYDLIGPFLTFVKKKITPLPSSDPAKCDLCGNCVYECPSDSITIENKTVKFHNTCIVCYRCWHVCPQDAISIKFSPGNGLIERSLYSNRMERFWGNIESDEYIGPNLYKDVLARKIKLKYDRKNPTAEYEYVE